jgi:hypothetical protein
MKSTLVVTDDKFHTGGKSLEKDIRENVIGGT